jgi:hypothetical protein
MVSRRDHETWTSEKLEMLAWYGQYELSFTLLPTSGRVYVRRMPKEDYNPECMVPTVKHRRGSVMVCAAISWYNVLLAPLLPFMTELLQGSTWAGWIIRCVPWSRLFFRTTVQFFQDDNAPIHTAGTAQTWFEDNEGELQQLPWQVKLPDFNII